MRILAAIEDPDIARKILECLKLPARAPPRVPKAVYHETQYRTSCQIRSL
jgi:hypothetical protein